MTDLFALAWELVKVAAAVVMLVALALLHLVRLVFIGGIWIVSSVADLLDREPDEPQGPHEQATPKNALQKRFIQITKDKDEAA